MNIDEAKITATQFFRKRSISLIPFSLIKITFFIGQSVTCITAMCLVLSQFLVWSDRSQAVISRHNNVDLCSGLFLQYSPSGKSYTWFSGDLYTLNMIQEWHIWAQTGSDGANLGIFKSIFSTFWLGALILIFF